MIDTPALMRQVMLALVPGTLVMAWYFGWGIVLNIALALVAVVVLESLVLLMRKKPLAPALGDGSACLAGWLLALALPPLLPWWITLIGCAAAMLLGKHLYGGLGFNPFNPAMVGYAFLLVSFPRDMTAWVSPDAGLSLQDALHYLLSGRESIQADWDAITMATPLDQLRTAALSATGEHTASSSSIAVPRANSLLVWRLINAAFFAGGIYLLWRKVISWHIPTAMLLTLFVAYAIDFSLFSASVHPVSAMLSGAVMLGAFFIATDPVTAATSPYGRLIYASGIGLLIFVIRKWGHYPEGVAFAVLLMNLTAPAIDYFYRPKAFGQ